MTKAYVKVFATKFFNWCVNALSYPIKAKIKPDKIVSYSFLSNPEPLAALGNWQALGTKEFVQEAMECTSTAEAAPDAL